MGIDAIVVSLQLSKLTELKEKNGVKKASKTIMKAKQKQRQSDGTAGERTLKPKYGGASKRQSIIYLCALITFFFSEKFFFEERKSCDQKNITKKIPLKR